MPRTSIITGAILLAAGRALGGSPGEVAGLGWCAGGHRECLAWTVETTASGYRLYRGVGVDLNGLSDLGVDSCLRLAGPNTRSGPGLFEAPAPGETLWFLVTAEDSLGEGPAGSGSFGPRVLDSSGACPFVCNPDYRPQPNVGLTEAPGIGGCPPGMVAVDAFCVDVFEASLVDAVTGAPWSPFVDPGTRPVRAVSVAGAIPQGYIDGITASDACQEAGKRLCTDSEWLRACQGPTGTTYPYGDDPQPGVCNDTRAVHPAVDYFGTTDPWIWSMLDHPCLNQLPGGLALTGAYTGCATAEGIRDMVGNLHEWTADPSGTFRGGYYVEATLNGPGCLYRTTAHTTSHRDFSTGFRCCADRP